LRRTGDGGEGSAASVLGERVAQAWRDGKRSGERCGETRWRCSPFIGGWGSAWGGVAGEFNAGINGFNAIKVGGGFKRGFKGGKMKARW
jgi:hypothetical protein